MAYIRNFRGSSGNRAIISGSNVQVTGSLFASTVSGTAAQFSSVTASLGSITAPSYTFSGDTNTGIYSPSADTISFVEGGVEALTISSNGAVTASGAAVVSGDLSVNGGDLTSTAATFNLLNTNSTTINFGGNCSVLNIGNQNTDNIVDLYGNGNTVYRVYNLTGSFVDGAIIGEFKTLARATTAGSYGTRGTIRTMYEGVSGAAEVRIAAGTENNVNLQSVAGFSAKSGISFYKNMNTDIVMNAGYGISFADTTPDGTSPSSELLDDYEEGTFTPTLTATSATYGYGGNLGTYVKVGNLVTAYGYIQLSSRTSNSSAVSISGLPFASISLGAFVFTAIPASLRVTSLTTAVVGIYGILNEGGNTTIPLYKRTASSASDSSLISSDLSTSTIIYFSVTYRTA